MDAATSVGSEAVGTVRNALLSAAALPRDVIEAALKGSEDEK